MLGRFTLRLVLGLSTTAAFLTAAPAVLRAQGVTTGSINGIVTDLQGTGLADAIVTAIHVPSGTQYRGFSRPSGAYAIPGMRVGGPYRVSVLLIGYRPDRKEDLEVNLGQALRVDFALERQAVTVEGIVVAGAADPIFNADRTGAATYISPEEVMTMPSIKRSTRDLTRLDPRSDGNMSFAGRNWLYNNISLDGSYFGNPFGLDDPAPGGQSNAEPVPYDAVEQVQVSLAPFDVRQGGFTGASINTVTRSGTNQLRASLYGFGRNESFQGNKVRGNDVIARPDLSFFQSGFSIGGPLIRDRLFFFVNAELERTDDPGTNFAANGGTGAPGFGVSRVRRSTMDSIRTRMMTEYNYDTGPYEGYIHETDNDKLLARIDWNLSPASNMSFRYNYLSASREQGPHPFVLSFANAGRGPNSTTLPFRNAGYAINNNLHSFAGEWNTRSARMANRLFVSYNRFRDFRTPFSEDFPTIDIGEAGVGYTTVGHEPFSIHNILDQDVFQITDNVSLYRGKHAFTVGTTFESFHFFNSFNIFRHGVFFLPYGFFPGTATFATVQDFFNATAPGPGQANFRSFIGSGLYKGEVIHVGQWALYAQDELLVTPRLNLTLGVRADFPIYFTKPVDNPFSRSRIARDETGATEVVDQSKLPSASPLFSPRIGFNLNAAGDRRTQLRGGTGIFTGRVPFVWIGNVLSNPGANPNLTPGAGAPVRMTGDSASLQQSFDLNAMDPNFKWPQAWTTDFAIDQRLPWDMVGTLEFLYSKDLNGVFMRNADLPAPVGTVAGPDGRPYYGGCAFAPANCPSTAAAPELNVDGGAGIYVIDNTDEGWSANVTAQLRKTFRNGLNASLAYSFTEARNALKSTEIASVLWQNQPVQGDPNNPGLSYSEFGQRHRIVGALSYARQWSRSLRTSFGVFLEFGEGNRFGGAGGNRYSFIYSGDVNGDGYGGNDLIYIPRVQADIALATCATNCGTNVTPAQQWAALDAFIGQDAYLSAHRGSVAERFGALNPWYSNIDLRILQDIGASRGGANSHRFQISLDILNLGNLVSSSWGVRKVASPAATSPLTLVGWTAGGQPQFNFTGPAETYIDDPNLLSRWRMQLGIRYLFN